MKRRRPNKSNSAEPAGAFVSRTQQKMKALQAHLKTPVIAFWTSTRGSISQNDVIALARLLPRLKRQSKVNLFLKSSGGDPEAALRLVHLLRQRFDHITLLAPFTCASAATMIALGANEIHMGPTSYLTAVDSSLSHDLCPVDHHNYLVSVSHDELVRIIRLWKEQKGGGNPYPEVYKYLHPLVLGALDRSSSLSIRICRELLGYHIKSTAKANKISRALNYDYPSHTYPITAREARRLGLQVRDLDPRIDSLLHELDNLYAQMSNPRTVDRDPLNQHNEEVYNVHETIDQQIYYQFNKDWYYRKEERRWVPMNDKSSWFSCSRSGRTWKTEQFFIR
jgi:hypothetical protein